MPRTCFIGNKLHSSNNYYETKITFDLIFNHNKLQEIEKPNEQGSLDSDKVELMKMEYLQNPHFLRFKNRIVIGVLNGTWYIIDGQHRIEMSKELYNDHNINDELIFCWYTCTNESEMRELFNSINHDSSKNKFYIQQTNFDQMNSNEFCKLLKKYHKNSFSKKKSTKGKIKTIEELRDELIQINYFENNNNITALYREFIEKNKEFSEIARFKIELENNPDNFYVPEIKHIQDNIIFSLKNTNFIQWLQDNTIDPIHRHKKGKKRISKKLRDECWIKEYGITEVAVCPISSCSITIYKNSKEWHAGHIISEYNGGLTTLCNLRPICNSCNLDMGTNNWCNYDTNH